MHIGTDVTVIIPYAGSYDYLRHCLYGLERQLLKPSKLIIVFDNCCVDNIACPEKYAVSGMDVSVCGYLDSEGRGNRAAVRNTGIQAATTSWLFFLDEDVILFPPYFGNLQSLVEDTNNTSVIHGFLHNKKYDVTLDPVDTLNSILHSVSVSDEIMKASSSVPIKRWMTFCTGNILVPRHLIQKAGLFDEQIRGWGEEDTEMGFRLYQVGADFYNYRRLQGVHLSREGINRRMRNRDWYKNLQYTLKKHEHEPEYLKERKSLLSFARRYS